MLIPRLCGRQDRRLALPKIFAISNTEQLAELLGMTPGKLNHVVHGVDKQYHIESRPKADGSERKLGVPSKSLKQLQREILDIILSKVPLLPCV